jgi:hypothetical protein
MSLEALWLILNHQKWNDNIRSQGRSTNQPGPSNRIVHATAFALLGIAKTTSLTGSA